MNKITFVIISFMILLIGCGDHHPHGHGHGHRHYKPRKKHCFNYSTHRARITKCCRGNNCRIVKRKKFPQYR